MWESRTGPTLPLYCSGSNPSVAGKPRKGSNPRKWRHVPGKLKPADDCSRGLSPDAVSLEHRWFAGSDSLSKTKENWRKNITVTEPSFDDPKLSLPRCISATEIYPNLSLPKFDCIRKKSDFRKLKRIMARILRYAWPRLKKRGSRRSDRKRIAA